MSDFSFYRYRRKRIGVVDVLVSEPFKAIKDNIGAYAIEDLGQSQLNWQVAYMEQYFSADKLTKYETVPGDDERNFRIVFFIYDLQEGQILVTPLGERIRVKHLVTLPKEYKETLIYEAMD
ncbi:MAG: hypothetical protein LBE09_03350 [Christensenellaceae bacterium]|jgi:hypothetical protein|nr:hypothetical protein [Christensenellaceae bacterium]